VICEKAGCLFPQAYLLTTVTVDRCALFTDLQAARTCIRAMQFQQEQGRVRSLAFVLMPDHLHWLVELQGSDLGEVMRSVKGFCASQVHRHNGTSGRLWQPGFHDHALRRDEDLLDAARYLVANPVRAGLVKRVWDYPHWDAVWVDG